jgi:coenzyme F420-reducing hydrogenase delta subunit
MEANKSLDLISKYLKSLSNSENERNDLYIFITENADQFLEVSERMVGEVKKIKDRHPNNWKEMVAMTMFSTL